MARGAGPSAHCIAIVALALASAPTALLAREATQVWSLKTWPGAAMLLQVRQGDERPIMLQSLRCTKGDPVVVRRIYQQDGEPRPEQGQKCGADCRVQISEARIDGLRWPIGFREVGSSFRAARRTVEGDLRAKAAADPWRTFDDKPLQLISAMAKVCALPNPAVLAEGKWKPVDRTAIVRPPGSITPTLPFLYGAKARSRDFVLLTKPTSPTAISEPLVLRVDALVTLGEVSVALRSADGTRSLSPEAAIEAKDGATSLFFEVGPSTEAASLGARNNDPGARQGAILIKSIQYVARADLSPEDEIDLKDTLQGQARSRVNMDIPALDPRRQSDDDALPGSGAASPSPPKP